ncbi:MAG TPA: efflux RND transporter periplasmic adaptor subunit [Syntrophomonadaceae bacterium]|nr:efflux RND transporter periplasmic adaptor subunit [Syntrophomonadaceae bacterium]
MKKPILNIIVLAFLGVTLLAGCGTGSGTVNRTAGINADQNKKVLYLMAGKIEAVEKADIGSEISARVASVNVDVGSSVTKGEPLIQLDAKDLEAQADQAQAAVSAARANLNKTRSGARPEEIIEAQVAYDNAEKNYERCQTVFKQGAISRQQLEDAELAYVRAREQLNILQKASPDELKAVQSQLDQAQAQLEGANAQLNNATITAPINGFISSKSINPGELAAVGQPLLTIVNSDAVMVNAYLPPSLISKVKTDQPVVIKVAELPGRKFNGEVYAISSAVDPQSRNFIVKVRFNKPDAQLKPGMFAEIGVKE